MIHHGDAKTRSKLIHEELTRKSLARQSRSTGLWDLDSWNLFTKSVFVMSFTSADSNFSDSFQFLLLTKV